MRACAAGYAAVLATVITGPLLWPGYLLLRDAVSTPRSYLTDTALGLGDAAPRAVPQDAAIAVLSTVADGGLVVKAILLAALLAAGWGAAALVRELLDAGLAGQLLAVTVIVWNPYVAERLLQGHWSLLTGYAALPWLVLATYRIRRSSHTAPARPWLQARYQLWLLLTAALAAAALTPTGGVLAAVVALVLLPVRCWGPLALLLVAANAPWLVAGLAGGAGGDVSDPAGVAAFAARAEPGLATIGSLAGLGGIWNAAAVPGSRSGPFALVATAVLLLVVLAGAWGLWSQRRAGSAAARVTVRRLAVLAAVAVVVPALGATAWGLDVGTWLVSTVPGMGLLRDTQKFVALAVPFYALAAAQLPRLPQCWRQARSAGGGVVHVARLPGAALAGGALVLLLAVLPDLAWGVGGQLRPVRYPPAWSEAAAIVRSGGDVAVLPGGMFRKFPFSGRAPVLDPAPRMLPAQVLQTGELPVPTGAVRGEGSRAATAEKTLLQGDPPDRLAGLGVGWVLVERTTPGPHGLSERTLRQLTPVYRSADLELYRVADPVTVSYTGVPRWAAAALHLLWAAVLVSGLSGLAAARTLQWSRQRSRQHARTADPQ